MSDSSSNHAGTTKDTEIQNLKPTAGTAPNTPFSSQDGGQEQLKDYTRPSVADSKACPMTPSRLPQDLFASPTPVASAMPSHVFGAPSILGSDSDSAPLSWSSYQDGSKNNPWLVMVNVERPEANREFDIEFVQQMTRGVFERNGFHIRMSVATLDYDKWEATIPRAGFPSEFTNRLVLVNGPSNTCWERDTDRYHKCKNLTCIQTKNAPMGTQLEITDSVAVLSACVPQRYCFGQSDFFF